MSEEKKVSVIIPFYKGIDWLENAVQSVLDQTYRNFEIIVINDGSHENVDDFLSKYREKVIYRYKENGGAATARNLGLTLATGEFIAFLDSDDVWLPEKTKKQIAFMEEIDVIWSHTGYYNWFPDINKIILKKNSNDYGNVYLQSFLSLKAPTPSIIIRRECFVKHPDFYFFEDMRYAQDAALWSKIAFYYPLALLDVPLVKVRQRGTNADRSAIIRFNVKSIIYTKICNGIYKKVPSSILMIYKFYVFGNKLLTYLKVNKIFKENSVELIGKFLWVCPFIMERVYVYILQKGKEKESRI
jgi:glycosyltransferase involved in cell wall biosynthesis